jgi:ADP-ribose pyrophosphatase YjhB (NUDIX family)
VLICALAEWDRTRAVPRPRRSPTRDAILRIKAAGRHNKGMANPDPAPAPGSGIPELAPTGQRLAGRVIVLDPANRVLLMRYDDGPPNGTHWSTPGGGLNAGEDYPSAARRELAEETGWSDIVLLEEVHRRTMMMEHEGRLVRQHERLYLARTDRERRQIRGVEAMHAADGIAAWRWWTLAELDSTAETVWPAELTDLIRAALRRR